MKTNQKMIKRNADIIIREFLPGDVWCYYKIYCSHLIGERVINEVIKPFIENCEKKEKNLIWFFIRYEDPQHHIRLRIKLPKIGELTSQLNNLLRPLVNEEYISSIQLDTYKREIERYKENNIEASEQFFTYDSAAVINALDKVIKLEDENLRWKMAVYSIDSLLDDFEIGVFERMTMMEKFYKSFLPEFVNMSNKEAQTKFKNSIDVKLRLNKTFLDETIRLKKSDSLLEFVPIFQKRSKEIKNISSQIKINLLKEELLIGLIQDYIHMNLNRIFPANARMHELVIYFLMYKTYYSIYNRAKKLNLKCT